MRIHHHPSVAQSFLYEFTIILLCNFCDIYRSESSFFITRDGSYSVTVATNDKATKLNVLE